MFIRNRVVREEAGDDGAAAGGGAASGSESIENLQTENSALKSEVDAMRAKMDELLTEAKKAKSAKREAEEQARLETERLAREQGDYQQLHKSLEEKYSGLSSEYQALQDQIANEKRQTTAIRLATELADGANAELLSEFLTKRLAYHEGGIKVTNANGELTVSTLEDLKNEFKNDARYSALLKGTQSSGGGASGGSNNSGGAAKVISRADFEALNAADRMKFVKSGGKLIDN